ncbi:urea ABC transporter ATP-binding subunit UrtE [Paenibacillus alkalitolerans]|uniref:urea ABC transporter ATP-binding subunit UrtE n=1 Tax=Paenibacillus alkalitolerans TaxID=2799335 RepID=UPI0018F3A3F4|nr:urea ABC transporter ATP-binding subunit UrtE [Paenibacillus alkalitolerans]
MLAISGIEAGYGESMVVRDVALTVPHGRVVCLMGRNGVGKTTLLKTIMGVIRAKRGSVRWDDAELLGKPPSARARCGIAYVPQGRDIFPQLTVEENVLLGLESDPRRAKGGAVMKAIYERFPVLYDMRGRRGGDLSGGQQQQLAFARALVSRPKTLLLDEPTEGIQPNIVQDIAKLITELKSEGLSILLVEQSLEFAKQTADEYAVMDKGTIAAQGLIDTLTDGIIKRHLTV